MPKPTSLPAMLELDSGDQVPMPPKPAGWDQGPGPKPVDRYRMPPRVPVKDTRTVDAPSRVAGNYHQPAMEEVIRQAGAAGIEPELALAMAIRENSSALANPSLIGGEAIRNPLHLNAKLFPVDQPASDQIEASMLHALERASAVAPEGRERQVQAYQGLGRQPTGYNERFLGQDNPYAKAVDEIRTDVVRKSPGLMSLIETTKPTLSLDRMSPEKTQAIIDSMTRRTRNPTLLK